MRLASFVFCKGELELGDGNTWTDTQQLHPPNCFVHSVGLQTPPGTGECQKWKSHFLDPHLTLESLTVSLCSFPHLQSLPKLCQDNHEFAHGDAVKEQTEQHGKNGRENTPQPGQTETEFCNSTDPPP